MRAGLEKGGAKVVKQHKKHKKRPKTDSKHIGLALCRALEKDESFM
jgi:hypothetical protein